MSSNDPYGPHPGQPGAGQPGQPGPGQPGSGQPPAGAPTPYGYPPQAPPAGSPPPGSGYAFGPFTPGPPTGPGGPAGTAAPRRQYEPTPGYGPPPPGAPPPQRSNRRVAIIAGAAALLVLGGGTGIVLASRDSGGTTPAPSTTRGSVPGPSASTVPVPAGGSASDAVTGYLRALAGNDPATALAYAAEPLNSGGTLSKKVLAASNQRAKLTAIDVPAVTDANATAVEATYKLGRRSVTETFPVTRVGADWKLQQAVATVSLTDERQPGVPLKINGVTVKSDTVSLFPGSYAVTSGLRTISYGKHDTLLVRRPSDVPDASRLELTMTSTGKKVARSAARKSYRACLSKKATAPKDCPFGLTTGDFKISKSTISWRQRGSDPFKRAKFSLFGRLIGVKIKIDVVLNADCTNKGRPATCSGDVKAGRVAYVAAANPRKRVIWRAS